MTGVPTAGQANAAELEELTDCLAPMVASLPTPDREAIELSEIQGPGG